MIMGGSVVSGRVKHLLDLVKRWAHVALHEYSESSAQPATITSWSGARGWGCFFLCLRLAGVVGGVFF